MDERRRDVEDCGLGCRTAVTHGHVAAEIEINDRHNMVRDYLLARRSDVRSSLVFDRLDLEALAEFVRPLTPASVGASVSHGSTCNANPLPLSPSVAV